MDVLTLQDIAIIVTPFLILGLGLVAAGGGVIARALLKNILQQIDAGSKKTEQLERDLFEFKASLPRDYILKDDYIRTLSSFEYKLDVLGKKIDKLTGGNNGSES